MRTLLALLVVACPLVLGWISASTASSASAAITAAAVIPGLALVLWHREAARLAFMALICAVVAGLLTAQWRAYVQLEEAPVIDLREAALPDPAPARLRLRGYFRDAWRLDEYPVADGEVPDQSQAAPAVLVPFLGTADDVAVLDGAIAIARIAPDRVRPGVQDISGPTRPAPPEVVALLVQVADASTQAQLRGVIVDTLAAPPRATWIGGVLALLAGMSALGCAIAAARSETRTARSARAR